ncbi:efflux RND transporter periplasmic adaptor subunit [Cupriavidus pauculus]|nr:efflux RND transporter periplasmic adaptor subunit [Cupriavidus pauculus]
MMRAFCRPALGRAWPVIVTVAVLAVAAVAGAFVWHRLSAAAAPMPLVAATRGDIEETVLATGTIVPMRQVNVGAQVSGQLKTLAVRVGDRVERGQLLAEIDPVLQQNELKRAEAALTHAEAQRTAQLAQLRQHRLAWKRELAMRQTDANTEADLDAARAQAEASAANVAALEATVRQARVAVESAAASLAYTRIVAPMDGQVISVTAEVGQTLVAVQSAPTILVLADLDEMLVKARISEADVVRVRTGQSGWFSILGAPLRRVPVVLRSISPAPPGGDAPLAIGQGGAIYYHGEFLVANGDHALKPSMTAQVSIVTGRAAGAVRVPAAAVNGPDEQGRHTVQVARRGADGRLAGWETREVEIGLSDHVWVQILRGVEEGEAVMVEPQAGGQAEARAEMRAETPTEAPIEARAEVRAGMRAEMQAEVRAEARAETRAETRADVRAGMRAETRAGMRAEARAEMRAGMQSDVRAGVRTETRTEMRAGMQSDVRAGMRADMRGEMRAGTRADVRGEMRAGMQADVRAGTRAEARTEMRAGVRADVRADVRAGMPADVRGEMRAGMRAETRAETRAEMQADVRAEMRVDVWDEMRADVWDEMRADVWDEMRADVRADVRDEMRAGMWAEVRGAARGGVWAEAQAEARGGARPDVWGGMPREQA